MANLLSKGSDTSPTSDDLIYVVDDPAGTPADKKVTLANAVTKAHGLGDGVVKIASSTMAVATQGTDYYKPGGTDVAIVDGGTGAGTKAAGYDALSPMTTQGDMVYGGASGTGTRLPIGTGLQILRTNAGATAPEWATVSSAGQTTYDAIVAPSGGDYTTLGAAIAAASNGWSIFVKEGTYSESAITSSLTNLSIVGESPTTAIFALTTVAWVFSGINVTFRNVGFTGSTGYFHLTGADAKMVGCRTDFTDVGSTTASLNFAGARSLVDQCYLANSLASGTPARPHINMGANSVRIQNSYITGPARSATQGILKMNSLYCIVSNCTIESGSNVAAAAGIFINSNQNIVQGNTFTGFDTGAMAAAIISNGTDHLIDSNVIKNGRIINGGTGIMTNNHVNLGTTTGQACILVNAGINIIQGNYLQGSQSTTQVGITVASSVDDVSIVGNYISVLITGITVNSGCDRTSIIGNTINSVTTPVNDSGTSTDIVGNTSNSAIVEKRHIYMKNTSGGTINAGNVVTTKAVAAGDEVTTTTTASDNLVYGVASAAINNNTFGYIQVLGKTTLLTVDGTTDIAIGDFLTTFTSAGIARKAAAGTLGTTPGDLAFAIALEAYTTNDSNGVLDALIITPRRL